MKITIDTSVDRPDDIRKAIEILRLFLETAPATGPANLDVFGEDVQAPQKKVEKEDDDLGNKEPMKALKEENEEDSDPQLYTLLPY